MIRIEDVQDSGRAIELRKLVVKLGSAVVSGDGGGRFDEATLTGVADSVAHLRESGVQVIVVSSGAIAMARQQFSHFTPRTIPDRQALAAVGQVGLMHAWNDLFKARGFPAAQLLLTRGDMEDRNRYLNARYTLERLFDLGAVPVINENDTVTVDELKFGDNDELSALVATKMDADLLVILSTVDGLYGGDPAQKARAGKRESVRGGSPIAAVERLDEKVRRLAGPGHSGAGTGGMITKLQAMELATRAGVHGVIAGGKRPGILDEIATGRFRGTYFAPSAQRRLKGRVRWIAYGRRSRGRLSVDDGARQALVIGKKSLLAAGISNVEGDFERGDLVEIRDHAGSCIAKGLVNYSSAEIEMIKGKRTNQIAAVLGTMDYPEVVHRDNLAMEI